MSDRNGLTSLLTDRKIDIKVGLGFVCVLAILVSPAPPHISPSARLPKASGLTHNE